MAFFIGELAAGAGCPGVDGGYAKLAIHLQKCYAEAERSLNAQLEEMLLLIFINITNLPIFYCYNISFFVGELVTGVGCPDVDRGLC